MKCLPYFVEASRRGDGVKTIFPNGTRVYFQITRLDREKFPELVGKDKIVIFIENRGYVSGMVT